MKFSRKHPGLLCWLMAGLFTAAVLVSWKVGFHPWNESIRSRTSLAEYMHDDFLAYYLWWAGVLNVGVWIFLGSTVRLWCPAIEGSTQHEPVPRPKYWRLTVLAVMGLAGFLASPRLMQSLWDDEQHSVLDFVHGQWMREIDDQGQVQQYFGKQSWWQTTMAYSDPNNHPLFSIAARASLGFWRWLNDKAPEDFHEIAFRFPAFLLGLLALPAWGWLARVLGMKRGAVALMLLLAVHPWFIRYISEGRGYAFVLFGLPLCLGYACLAFRTGSTRWWLRFSFWQIFLLLSWPGIGLMLVVMNLALLGTILSRSDSSRPKQFFSWGAANLISLALFLQWFLPGMIQNVVSNFEYPRGDMDARYTIGHL